MEEYFSVTAMAVFLGSMALAAGVGFLARGQDRGLQYWGAAFALHAVVYGLVSLRNPTKSLVAVVVANVALACTLALIAECVCQFQSRRCVHWLIWFPVVIVAGGGFPLADNMSAHAVLGGVVFSVQSLLIVMILLQKRQRMTGGLFIVASGAAVSMGLFTFRAVVPWTSMALPIFLVVPGQIQTNGWQLSILSLMLLVLGFELLARPNDGN